MYCQVFFRDTVYKYSKLTTATILPVLLLLLTQVTASEQSVGLAMHIPTARKHALEREKAGLLHSAAGVTVTAVKCGDIEGVVAESCDILGIARKMILWRSSLVLPLSSPLPSLSSFPFLSLSP